MKSENRAGPGLRGVVSAFLSRWTILQSNRWPVGSRRIILTFDDGPSEVSGALLDVLRERGVRSTFCHVGVNVSRRPEITKRALAEGHVIANHSNTHRVGSLMSGSSFDRDLLDADEVIERADSEHVYSRRFFRPPYGLLTPGVRRSYEASRRQIAHLSFYINDPGADHQTGPRVFERLKTRILKSQGAAIVLHEMQFHPRMERSGTSKEWLVPAVRDFITWAHWNGMTFAGYDDEPEIWDPFLEQSRCQPRFGNSSECKKMLTDP